MITPRYYQEEALQSLYDFFVTHKEGNPLVGLPTGTGKSILPAIFIQRIMQHWPNQRFLLATHVKELIQQNANVMLKAWPHAPLGIYSAGLKRKETVHPIIFGGVQSMVKQPHLFGHRDIAFVDEAHLVSGDESSMYQTFFAHLKLRNPNLKIIGMSATLYRMGMGSITDNGLFTHVAYDMTSMEGFNKLIDEGFLCPLAPFPTKTELDISSVGIQKGEFVATQLQGAVDKAEVTYKALQELVNVGQDRRSWLIFASGIEHAEHIAEQLSAFGIDCAPVHSKRPMEYNDAAIKAFKNFELRSIVNYGKLTTGFDHPNIDLIGMLRPTLSVPLWVQMLGRGTRPADGKKNCIVLDFARNTTRLGPINDPQIPSKKIKSDGEVPVKICDNCGCYNHTRVRTCTNCGAEFSFEVKITANAGTAELIRKEKEAPVIVTYPVDYAIYQKHEKVGMPPSIKATYFSGHDRFNEFVCLQHKGLAKHKANDWWRKRVAFEPPNTVDEAMRHVKVFRTPKLIRVQVNLRYPEILGVEF